jgi:SAM-dependent methyltransferase
LIWDALGDADSIVNVGAGAGSYEPRDRRVMAVEPAITMIRQRTAGAAPVVRACAEALPFPSASFAAALAVLSVHHWSDWQAGLRELLRVSRRKVVLFTWDPQSEGFWLADYFPHLLEKDRQRFPTLTALRAVLGGIEAVPVPIPHDCSDGFMGAYWRRPSAYLDPKIRAAISSLAAQVSTGSLARLADELGNGVWERKYGPMLQQDAVDLGYRLVVANRSWRSR